MSIIVTIAPDVVAEWTQRLDPELQHLLATVERETGERWAICPVPPRRPWVWYGHQLHYVLHVHLEKTLFGEQWQAIGFYHRVTIPSSKTVVPRESIIAYLLGYLAGQAYERNRSAAGDDQERLPSKIGWMGTSGTDMEMHDY